MISILLRRTAQSTQRISAQEVMIKRHGYNLEDLKFRYTNICFWISTAKISTARIDNTKDYVFHEFGQSSNRNSTSQSNKSTFDSSFTNHNVPHETEENNFDYAAEILPIQQSIGKDEQQDQSDLFQSVVNDSISSIREIHSRVEEQKQSRKKLQGKKYQYFNDL